MKYVLGAETDIGISRKENEDSVCTKKANTQYGEIVMAIVCDGMGGLKKGELASSTTVKKFNRWFEEKLPNMLENFDWNQISASWKSLAELINLKISEYGANEQMRLGTTFCGMLIIKDRYMIMNIGDSRAYKLSGTAKQLTVDQSFVQREIDRGRITEEEAKTHPKRSVLLQCIGASRSIEPDFYFGSVKSGDTFLLCTDGFRHVLSKEEMSKRISFEAGADSAEINSTIKRAISVVKQRGERDNITAAVIYAE